MSTLPWEKDAHKVVMLPANQHRGLAIGLSYSFGPLLDCILAEQRHYPFRIDLSGPVCLDDQGKSSVVLLNLMGQKKCDEDVILNCLDRLLAFESFNVVQTDEHGKTPLDIATERKMNRVKARLQPFFM